MKEKLLLIGSGGFGRVVSEFARQEYECFFVDDGFSSGIEICGIPVIGHVSDIESLFNEYKLLVVSIGDNKLREKIYANARKIGYIFPNIIADNVYISPFSKIGDGCIFLNNVCIQNGSQVGNGVILTPNVEMHHDSFIDDYSLIYTNSVIRTNAKVGKCVKIGSCVTIKNNTTVSDNSIISDGQTV